jgi:plastocyanin
MTATGHQFTTGNIGHNQTTLFGAPEKKGVYHYYCFVHQFMVAILRVTRPFPPANG